jgi:hypothetical protein
VNKGCALYFSGVVFLPTTTSTNVSLKTEEDIDAAVKFFNDTVQWAGWNATR